MLNLNPLKKLVKKLLEKVRGLTTFYFFVYLRAK
jgi:hypothetical protein